MTQRPPTSARLPRWLSLLAGGLRRPADARIHGGVTDTLLSRLHESIGGATRRLAAATAIATDAGLPQTFVDQIDSARRAAHEVAQKSVAEVERQFATPKEGGKSAPSAPARAIGAARARVLETRIERAAHAAVRAEVDKLQEAHRCLGKGGADSGAVAEVERELFLARRMVRQRRRSRIGRSTTAIGDILAVALESVVPPVGTGEAHVYSFAPIFEPPGLRYASMARRTGRTLNLLIREIANEASQHGHGRVAASCRLEGSTLVVDVANELGGPTAAGSGGGLTLIRHRVSELPGGTLVYRGREPAQFPLSGETFVVRFSFSTDALDRHDPRRLT
jgi:hypothetical protein